MVRKTVVLDDATAERLKRRAAELGVTQSDLVRRALDEMLAEGPSSAGDRVWAEAERVMRGVGRARFGSGGRRVSRDSLHER